MCDSDVRNDEEAPMWSMMGDSSFQADMSRQELSELPESLYARTTLQILDVHSNKLTSLGADIGNSLTRLPLSAHVVSIAVCTLTHTLS
jgi:Leucine-rich repeat (LRR) protein